MILHFSCDANGANFGINCVNSLHFAEGWYELGLEVEPATKKIFQTGDIAVEKIFSLRMLN